MTMPHGNTWGIVKDSADGYIPFSSTGANEGTPRQDQYKEALHTLNKEVKKLRGKLEEENCHKEKEQEARVAMEKELTALLGQVETARVDVIAEFKASQPFINACVVYYEDGFEDCLKQVKSVYPHLDLSWVSMDDPLPSTPTGDTTLEETNYSTESKPNPKDDSVVLAQPAVNPPVALLVLSTKPRNIESPSIQDA
ncbi:hypothetical protein SO802_033026 [Lithocarpus litseifolius]|uniref:Uncharacterized protein n=1 Tax=Lithocarpus litseifolius TaxID=425828 RepID=A0AAW2BDX6_9ROSI